MASAAAQSLVLTGILLTTDSYERVRLCLVDALPSRQRSRNDSSWARLRAAIPKSGARAVPYRSSSRGNAPDDAGIWGECWITVSSGHGLGAQSRRRRLLGLAAELCGKEVRITATPKHYSFTSKASHNRGTKVAGTSLRLDTLEALDA